MLQPNQRLGDFEIVRLLGKGGKVIGATDEFGLRAVKDPVHVNDLHATILKLLGLDHTKLTFLFQGRPQRLTDVGGEREFADRLLR